MVKVDKKEAEVPQIFVSHVSDPSPAAPAPAKGRRLKMVQETTASSAMEEPVKTVAPPKRAYRGRKAK